MFSETVTNHIKKLDVYRKLPTDLTEPTASGAIISLVATIVMALLFLSEFNTYLSVGTQSEMFVDINRGGDKLIINFDIELPRFPCSGLTVDLMDVMGTHVANIQGTIQKERLGPQGELLPADDSSITAQLFKDQLNSKEGCRMFGNLFVNKVPGNFHISTHSYHSIITTAIGGDTKRIDLSHKINHLSFGETEQLELIQKKFDDGVIAPLDGKERMRAATINSGVSYEYYLKVVPTTYESLDGTQNYVYQFTSNTNELQGNAPAIYFRYDLSPVTVKFTHYAESFFHFIVQVCAIVGGVFTVAGIVDSLIHASMAGIIKRRGTKGKIVN